jgi:prepilin-type N-terminal cleavage/methylation domain-containing protein
MKRNGFTLVELVVVLAVIAVLTHLAMRELSHLRDAKLVQAADRQLEEIRDAVYTRVSGEEATGFLADMGRLPRLADDVRAARPGRMSVTNATLCELWRMPPDAKPYAVRQATAENLVPGLASLANDAVYVPTGWRGPYIRLPFGKTRLYDPWGNPIEGEDEAGLSRLSMSNGFVTAVSHFGPRAQASGIRSIQLAPNGIATSSLIVSTTSASDTSVTWYGPANGLITGAIHTVSAAVPYTFKGLTPGTRILYYNGAAHTINVKPGDNLISIDQP